MPPVTRHRPTTWRRLASLAAGLGVCAGAVTSCGGSSSRDHPAAPTPTATPSALSASSTAMPTTSPSGSLPPEAPAVQGKKYYAVFLAVATDINDPGLVAAQERAKKLGYEGGAGDIGCTPGAREQLRLAATGDYTGFSVLFATKAEAEQLAAAYGEGVVGIASVTAGCLD